MKPILIIGKKPLPIGGVTIYVERLLDMLKVNNIDYVFYDLNDFSILSFIKSIYRVNYAHLNTSSPYLRLFFVLLCWLFNTKSILTIHGNMGRFNSQKNTFDNLAIKIANYPIVINQHSYDKAIKINKRTELISAYLPSLNENILPNDIKNKVTKIKEQTDLLCCTNAYNRSFDKFNNEIYGIDFLISFFTDHPNWGLIIADPSGAYKELYSKNILAQNIFIIGTPVSFIGILKLSDCFIRNTSTDGDSISIHEALQYNVHVIATDVVDRPQDVVLVKYNEHNSLREKISYTINMPKKNNGVIINGSIVDLYKKVFHETNHPIL